MLRYRTDVVLVVIMIPVLAVVALLQAAVGPHLALLQAKPNLILLLVLTWTLIRGRREGMFLGFCGGVWLDLLGMSPPGLSSLALVLASFLTGVGRHQVLTTHILVPAWAAIWGTLIYTVMYHLMLAMLQTTVVWLLELSRGLWIQIVLQTTLMLMLMPFLRQLLGDRSPRAAQTTLGHAG